jgi:hypothetical protein
MDATGATMDEPGIRARRPWADPVLIAMATLTVAALPWFWFAGPSSAAVSSWFLQFGLDLLTATFAVRLSRATAGSPYARRFWRAVVLGGVSCTVGDGYQTFRVILNPHEKTTSVIQTVFVVFGMSSVVLTMLAHPLGGSGGQRLRLWLDAATVLTVLTTGSLRLQEVLTVAAPTSPATSRRSSRLPYLAVVVTQVLLVVVLLDLHADVRVWGVAAGTLAITALVVDRQLAAFHDNERLLTERSGSVP